MVKKINNCKKKIVLAFVNIFKSDIYNNLPSNSNYNIFYFFNSMVSDCLLDFFQELSL